MPREIREEKGYYSDPEPPVRGPRDARDARGHGAREALLQGAPMSVRRRRRERRVPMAWYEAMYERGLEGVWGRSSGRSR